MNLDSSFSNPSFKGRREDLKQLKSLTENNMPILPNKRNLILSAIDNLGKTGEKQDIEMLMGTVETMKYGIQNNSEFAKALGGTQGEKENTDWDGILQNTIQNAINGTEGADKEELQARFQKIFGEEKPLTEQEKTMLQLRSDILSTDEMKNVLGDADKTLEAARVTQNLDYFIASSEINNDDKIKCLGLMKHFLSDEYEIHPQLKDYKVQAFSEMVNDLIVKRPDEEVYTIKDVSQKQTGMCAAISIARKTIAYEDKVRAMEIMMAELDNKPTMEVYDRTELGTGKKVQIEKAHVDFTDGMKKGYRIIDTGTHQWMNAADTVGDGTIKAGHYQAFDPDNYEIFRDAHWRNDLPEEYKPAQNWLRYLDKEQEAVKTASRRASDIAKIQREIGEYKKSYEADVVKSDAAIRNALKEIDPSISDTKATTLTRQILKADKIENKEFKLVSGESKDSRNTKLAALIKSELPNASESVLAEKIDSIAGLRELSNSSSDKLAQLGKHSTPQAIFAYNKNLFTAAAHHRRSVQAELNVPERLSAYEKALNVPVREGLVQDSAQKILNNLTSQAVLKNAAERFGTEPNAEDVKFAVNNAITQAEIVIPSKLDEILNTMQMGDRTTVITSFLDKASEKIQAGDAETLQSFAENAHIKADSAQVLKKIATVKASLSDSPSNKQIAEAVNLLGYNNQIEMTADMYKTFVETVENGSLSKEQLTAVLGNNSEEKIAELGKEIKSLSAKQNQIENQLGLPSRQEVVLNALEATGEIVTEKTLQNMQAKFDKVAEVKAENDNRIVDPSVKKPKVPDSVYKFTPEEKQQYAQIEAKLPAWKNYAKVNAKEMNAALAPQLEELSRETGRLTGHLWVDSEGSSGLYDNQSIKVLEMITGKHYYNEEDTDKVVEHIKSGLGSGTSSTNVSHKEYSGHAQYVAEVSQVPVIDPETKETVMKDVLWHDNTWGRAEDKNVWTDENGVQRADYGNGYGGPDGYVFNPHLLTGTFVDDTKYQVGITGSGDKFRLWTAVRLQGENPEADKKISSVIDDIMSLGNAEEKVAAFEDKLRKSPAVDMKSIDTANDMMSKLSDLYVSKIEKANIKSEQDLEKLPQEVRFMLDKTAMQMSVPSKQLQDNIANILDEETLANLKDNLPEAQKEVMSAPFLKGKMAARQVLFEAQNDIIGIFSESFTDKTAPKNLQKIFNGIMDVPTDKLDGSLSNLKAVMAENVNEKLSKGISDKKLAKTISDKIAATIEKTINDKFVINSIEDFKAGNDTADLMIKYIDKKFNTSSDADLLSAMQKLQNMSNEEFTAFMADATEQDLGLKNVDAVDVARQIYAQKGIPTDLFQTNTRIQTIYTAGPEDQEAAEWSYHKMKQDITPIENSIFVDKIKQDYKSKYGVVAAFPEAVIMKNDEIVSQVNEELGFIKESVLNINNSKNKAQDVAKLNAEVKAYVDTNITNKYKSKTMALVNSYIKAVRNNDANAENIANDISKLVSQGHIAKNPDELVHTFVNEVQAKVPNEDKISQLREYLTQAVEASDIANVEYGLIKNAEKGIETMTKQAFDDYQLTTNDGKTVTLNSDEGILFLANKLANPANNSTALQVLFAHTGLSERAVDVLNKSIKLDGVSQLCDEAAPEIKNIFENIKNLKSEFTEFSKENTVKYASYKDAVQHYVKVLDKEYANKSDAEKAIYKAYKTFLLKTQNADFAKNISSSEIMPMLEEVHGLGIDSLSKQGASTASEINSIVEAVENRLSAMKALKLPENSEKEAIRQKFISDAEATYNKLIETVNSINESIS